MQALREAATFLEGCLTVTLIDQLRERRATARTAAEAVLTRAAGTGEPMTAEDLAEHSRAVADEREAADAIEAWHADQLADIRASSVARPPGATGTPAGDVLSRDQSVADRCRTRGHSGFDEPVSFSRYLKGLATGDWAGADHERALSEGTLTAGGHLVPTPLSARVIDLARNQSQVLQAGGTTVPMTSQTLKLARLTGEGTPGWKSEGSAITATSTSPSTAWKGKPARTVSGGCRPRRPDRGEHCRFRPLSPTVGCAHRRVPARRGWLAVHHGYRLAVPA
jgi:HK97 family phage major capsid protein